MLFQTLAVLFCTHSCIAQQQQLPKNQTESNLPEIPLAISGSATTSSEFIPDEPLDESSSSSSGLDDDSDSENSSKKSETLNALMDRVFASYAKQSLGINGLDSLKRTAPCSIRSRHNFYCIATADTASIDLDTSHNLQLNLRMKIRGKIRRGRVTKIRMDDADVDVKTMPDEINMWRPRGLRKIQRELKRRYLRLAIATRRLSRRMLPADVKV